MRPRLPRHTLILTAALCALGSLAACAGDESISGYADREATYSLVEMLGEPFGASATISFPEPGRLEGRAPCNAYFGAQSSPYPWFSAEAIATTRRACPDLPAETAFLAALSSMTLAEVSGDVLILSDDEGNEMVFRRQE